MIFSKCNVCCFCSPFTSRAHMSGRDGEGASEAPPRDENVHVHQQDSPHGLPPILPGGGARRRLLWRHQEQEEEGGVPLHRRHLVLRGDGNCSGVRLLQVPVVTAPQFATLSQKPHTHTHMKHISQPNPPNTHRFTICWLHIHTNTRS